MGKNQNRVAGNGARRGKQAPHSLGAPRLLSATMEDYMEAIYCLADNGGTCRVSNLAEVLGVKRPSVSKALHRLQRQGLVRHTPYGGVDMTERGRRVARRQVRIHRVLTRFLAEVLNLPRKLAEHDACLIEHAISNETVDRLVEFIAHHETHRPHQPPFRQRLPSSRRPVRMRTTDRAWESRV